MYPAGEKDYLCSSASQRDLKIDDEWRTLDKLLMT